MKNNSTKPSPNMTNNSINYKQKVLLPKKSKTPLHLLLLGGDIKTNPGPIPNILETHPSTHKKNVKYTSYHAQSNYNPNINT